MNILIVGAGAVGGFYGAKLAQSGEDVTFLARGKILAALQSQELQVKSFQGDFSVRVKAIGDVRALTPPDLMLLAVKTYDTDQVLAQLAAAVGPNTTLLSLQNGVESEAKMAEKFGADKVIGGVCYIGAEVLEPGLVNHCADGAVTIGELDGRDSARIQTLYEVFKKAGVNITKSHQIKRVLWRKLLWNVPFNQVCTITRASVGELLDSEPMCELLRGAMREVVAMAQVRQIGLNEKDIEKHLEFSNKALRAVRPSMLQDLERGKRLEHDTFGGFIVREGKQLGVPTPINEMLYEFLCFLDPEKTG